MSHKRSSGRLECFNCGGSHHVRDCPKPKDSGFNHRPHVVLSANRPPAGAAAAGTDSGMNINLGPSKMDAQKRIKQLLILLTPDEKSLTRMSEALLEDIRAHELTDFLFSTLLHCIKSLPQKTFVFVGLVAALRTQQTKGVSAGANVNPDADKFMYQFLDLLSVEFATVCKAGRWDELRLLLRFATGLGLSGLVRMETVWQLVDKVRHWLANSDLAPSKRDYLLYTLVTLLPFLSDAFSQEQYQDLKHFVNEHITTSAAKRKNVLAAVSSRKPSTSLSASSSKSSTSSEYANLTFSFDPLECWQNTLLRSAELGSKQAFMDDASELSIQRSSYQYFESHLSKLAPLNWNAVDHVTLPTGPAPRLRQVLRLFPRVNHDSSSSSSSSSSTSSSPTFPLNDLMHGDYVSDLLVIFEALHKEGAKQLLSLPLPVDPIARQNGQFLLIESIFSNLFTLPTCNVRPLFYGTIFIDLFKAQPNLMPPLVGGGVNFLFHHIDSLDLEVVERLQEWFTFHLSNFGYIWPWISWNYILNQSSLNWQKIFVGNSLALCVRLSYWERIQQVIPEEFLSMMPALPSPAFRFSHKNMEISNGDLTLQQYFQFSQELISIIQNKASATNIIQWLDQTVTPVLGSEARLRLFTPCILECGNKSYSHIIQLLDRYKVVFHTLCTTTMKRKVAQPGEDASASSALDTDVPQIAFECHRIIVHCLAEYWQHSIQHIIVLMEHLYNFQIVDIQAVYAWVFFGNRLPVYQLHLWRNILYPLLRKALVKIEKEIDNIAAKPASMALATGKREADQASMESLRVERNDLLHNVVMNFQKLLDAIAAKPAVKESEKERNIEERKVLLKRFVQFTRNFASDLAPTVDRITQSLPKNSSLHEVAIQIPLIL